MWVAWSCLQWGVSESQKISKQKGSGFHLPPQFCLFNPCDISNTQPCLRDENSNFRSWFRNRMLFPWVRNNCSCFFRYTSCGWQCLGTSRKEHKGRVLMPLLCPALGNPMDCSPPGSSFRGILQARILERVAIPFSRGSSRPRDQTRVSHTVGRFYTLRTTREARKKEGEDHFSLFEAIQIFQN